MEAAALPDRTGETTAATRSSDAAPKPAIFRQTPGLSRSPANPHKLPALFVSLSARREDPCGALCHWYSYRSSRLEFDMPLVRSRTGTFRTARATE